MSDERDHRPDGSSGSFKTLDDSIEENERALTMAELKAQLERERQAAAHSAPVAVAPEPPRSARTTDRDDELLDDVPATDNHLGGFAGWRAHSWLRWTIGGVLGTTVIVALVFMFKQRRDERYAFLHPVPELEATIAPGSPREMTYEDGSFRIMLSREAPSVNLVHLPDRDITLARGSDRASFKVEVRDGKTIAITVLTGEIVEKLTREGAEPLLGE